MSIIAIIPARMASTRFPGKPLTRISGIPMIGHVFFRTRMAQTITDVYVATCDMEIMQYIESIGGSAVMTADTHERATDRTAEAAAKIEAWKKKSVEIVVMVQGDEPLVTPECIDRLVLPMLSDPSLEVTNLMAAIENDAEFNDPNVVKVVVDSDNNALYFSREPIPSKKKARSTVPMFKQLGIIAFRKRFLDKYLSLSPTILEKVESVDMLRIIEHGFPIRMVQSPVDLKSVDTPKDLVDVESIMTVDRLLHEYMH